MNGGLRIVPLPTRRKERSAILGAYHSKGWWREGMCETLMSSEPLTDSLVQEDDPVLALGMDRRGFMARAALLGLTAATAPVFIAAMQQKSPAASVEPFPDPTRFDGFGASGGPFSQLPELLSPGGASPDEPSRVSHLLWRAGFGASPAELARFREMGLQATIDYLVDYDASTTARWRNASPPRDWS